jgi:TonB-dependent SusC/RagA subfamily outer membrane receptor
MEAFAFYLLKSVIWISGFALVYLLFLRNERFFLLNRIYLLTGILASFLFPFISIHYTVILPVTEDLGMGDLSLTMIKDDASPGIMNLRSLLIFLYSSGALFVVFRLFRQSKTVLKVIKNAEVKVLQHVKLIQTSEYSSSFSFFSYVFVNPSVTDVETKEIVIHEMAHIRQKHWIDLLLIELLCLLQWFNPVVWIYIRFIRQNHEYLADEVALQRTSDPAVYRAALINQIVGSPVIVLANSFNYSINKKRFNMMKNIISSPYRKMRLLLILPVIAVVLYSFAKPEYKYIISDESITDKGTFSVVLSKEVKGTIVSPDGKPLEGASVVLKGTTTGSISDSKGFFRLPDVPDDGLLVVSYVGLKSSVIKPIFTSEMTIKMVQDTVTLKSIGVPPPPPPPPPSKVSKDKADAGAPPPPPPPSKVLQNNSDAVAPPPPPPPPLKVEKFKYRSDYGGKPLVLVNGIVRDLDTDEIDPNLIESITVKKYDASATALYGEEARDGVMLITLKPGVNSEDLTIKPGSDMESIKVTGYGSQNKKESISVTGYGVQNKSGFGQYKKGVRLRSEDGSKPLVFVDGVERDIESDPIDGDNIESIDVIKDKQATNAYGLKGNNGVILITAKKKPSGLVLLEEMPSYPGGEKAMQSWLYSNMKVKKRSEKISEPVIVVFTVDGMGKVRDAKVLEKKYPTWEAEAIRVVSSMPDWKPGMQNGKPIDVVMQLPIDFSTVKK